ncbi:uncharacterized protein LOC113230496 [Hyposmocoma kahamanoa]|uniref:uncharacterized protein LOC113230496 n=1 Tax=Hyposmocoma kahamanoa TaxID=1477025 RepID=UPI000E6D9A2F|nr:uncharacterized protein LOC113230496 [Hyposmocoma kahamanoa]
MSYLVLILMLSVLTGFIATAHVEKEHGKLDVAKIASLSTFYNTKTNQTLTMKRPSKPETLALTPFASPCSCDGPQCKCCTGIRIHGFGFDREACAVLTYKAEESKLDLELRMNNNSLLHSRFSTQDRLLCLPVIPITIAGPVDWCVQLYNTNVVEQRLHTCLAMLVRIAQYPFLTLQFNCMDLGVGGISITRPGFGGPDNTVSTEMGSDNSSMTTISSQLDSDVYDTVSQNKLRANQSQTNVKILDIL